MSKCDSFSNPPCFEHIHDIMTYCVMKSCRTTSLGMSGLVAQSHKGAGLYPKTIKWIPTGPSFVPHAT